MTNPFKKLAQATSRRRFLRRLFGGMIGASAVGSTVALATPSSSEATFPTRQSADPFLAEIVMFGGNFAPRGWALCEGQLLPIAQNAALFSLLGTTYGGDGRTTFALPDLRGRMPFHPGTGPGLSTRQLGQKGGSETVTLTLSEIPAHSHQVTISNGEGSSRTPENNFLAGSSATPYSTKGNAAMHTDVVRGAGGGQSHNNMPPFLGINFIIALQGTFPSRS